MIVVYVHGNGNKVRKDLLKRQWDQALFGRDAGASSRMAYWAPVLHPTPLPDPEFDEVDLPPAPAEAAALEAAAPEAASPEAPAELAAYASKMESAAEALAVVEQGEAAPDGAEVIPLPRAARIAIFKRLVRLTFRDVSAYFFGGHREAMRDVVRQTIADIDEPFVMVGHSLGSILAYDVLREEGERSKELPLLVTIGSPLGVQEIQDLITAPLEVPAGVAAWLNASDSRDVVALDHSIRPEYEPPDRCTDVRVTNASANHHGARQYLASSAVRDAVHEALTAGDGDFEAAPAPVLSEEELTEAHRELVKRLGPTVVYDSRERYFADSVATFVENRFDRGPMARYATRLRRSDGTVFAGAHGGLELGFLGTSRYGDDQEVEDGDRLDPGPEPVADARRMHEDDNLGDVIYGRVAARRGGGIWLQYWLFYFHSAKGIPGVQAADGLLGAGLHQGDWELVQLGIPADEVDGDDPNPDIAILAAHDYAHFIDWQDADHDPDGALRVYVGRGSHATYPKAGRWKAKKVGPFSFGALGDVADARGERRRPEVQVIRTGEPGWVGWPGLWGTTKSKPIIGGGSPRGPWRQRPWRDPDGFASDALAWIENHVPTAELETAPGEAAPAEAEAPVVTVVRERGAWTVTIAVSPGTEDTWLGTLTLASTGRDDADRSLWLYDVSLPGAAPAVGEGES
jgi:hypothetical protein